MRTVIGLLDDLDEAQKTMKDLERLGLRPSEISLVSPEPGAGQSVDGLSLTPLNLPGIGRIAATGPMVQFLTPSTAHSNAGALIDTLRRWGVSQEEAAGYVEGVKRGYTLEAAVVADDKAQEALAIMREHTHELGGERAERRVSQTVGAGPTTIPVVEEQLVVGKREIPAGGVRVSTHVLEQPVAEQITLRQERIDVQRRPLDQPIHAPTDAFREQTIEVVATSEEPIVTKQARVVEEVVVRKDVGARTETVKDTVRKTEVQVHDVQPFDQSLYQDHYRQMQSRFGKNEQVDFAQYEPAYRFGHALRGDRRYSGSDWSAVEPEARRAWDEQRPGTWERFKDSIRHAWDKATD